MTSRTGTRTVQLGTVPGGVTSKEAPGAHPVPGVFHLAQTPSTSALRIRPESCSTARDASSPASSAIARVRREPARAGTSIERSTSAAARCTIALSTPASGDTPAMAEEEEFDPPTRALLDALLAALHLPDEAASMAALVPLLHPSLLEGGGLGEDDRKYRFKKAHHNAPYYRAPVDVVRVRERGPHVLGGEPGQLVDFFVARVDASTGESAPVQVFFPDDGGPPRIAYYASF